MDNVVKVPSQLYLRVSYGWNEATNLACAIADLADSHDIGVQFVSTDGSVGGVHDRWNARVRQWPRQLAKSAMTLWFEPRLTELLAVYKQSQHVLVTHSLRELAQMRQLEAYCQHVAVCAPDLLPLFIKSGKARCVPAQCSVLECCPLQEKFEHCVWLIDGRTLRKHGQGLVQTLRLFLDFNREMHVVLICQGSCDAATSRMLADMCCRYSSERFSVVKRASRQRRQEIYKTCGWSVILSCLDGGLTYLLECLYAGLAPTALNFGVAGELLKSVGGWPLQCRASHDRFGSPQAEIDHADLLYSLQDCYAMIKDGAVDLAAETQARLRERRARFESGWRELWQLH